MLAGEKQRGIELRRLRDFGEEQRERVLVDIFGELIEDLFETFSHIDLLFLQRVKDTHQGATRMGASIRGRAETDLPGVGDTENVPKSDILGRDRIGIRMDPYLEFPA